VLDPSIARGPTAPILDSTSPNQVHLTPSPQLAHYVDPRCDEPNAIGGHADMTAALFGLALLTHFGSHLCIAKTETLLICAGGGAIRFTAATV
jgi:hypothetical protein